MIYLDSAATSLLKPPQVRQAVDQAMEYLASPGRGSYRAAMDAAEVAFRCRSEAARLFHAPDPDHVVLTFNATHALNLAIKSLVGPGETVVLSGYEHNAVTRPLHALGARLRVARAPLFRPEEMLEQFGRLLEGGEVKAAVCTCMSNVFGYILPVDGVARLCRERDVPLIVDASQAAGCLPVDMERWQAAFVAMPGHKGLCGPQGTGLLLCQEGGAPLLEGGTGSLSERQEMPDFLPDRLEAGTPNMPGIAGLLAGLRFVAGQGVEEIGRREGQLISRMARTLEAVPGVEVFAQPPGGQCQGGVLSFRMEKLGCEEAAQELARRGFALRAGLHCAPLAHETAGTLDTGTIRASVSPFTTWREAERFLYTVACLAV